MANVRVGDMRRALRFHDAYQLEHEYANAKLIPHANQVVIGYNLVVEDLKLGRRNTLKVGAWCVGGGVLVGVVVGLLVRR